MREIIGTSRSAACEPLIGTAPELPEPLADLGAIRFQGVRGQE